MLISLTTAVKKELGTPVKSACSGIVRKPATGLSCISSPKQVWYVLNLAVRTSLVERNGIFSLVFTSCLPSLMLGLASAAVCCCSLSFRSGVYSWEVLQPSTGPEQNPDFWGNFVQNTWAPVSFNGLSYQVPRTSEWRKAPKLENVFPAGRCFAYFLANRGRSPSAEELKES